MAAITFNATHQKDHVRKQLKAAFAAFREMLDIFVTNQIRRAAAEAEQVHLRQPLVTHSQSTNLQ